MRIGASHLVLLLALLPARAADEDPTDVLMRLRDQVAAHSARIPNHTCVETIDRDRYEPSVSPVPKSCDGLLARRRLPGFASLLRKSTTDRLRLDVAFAETREIYSWAGASKFEEGEIDELIPYGAMGTGPFATMLISAFSGRTPRFTFEGETTLDHRLVFQYTFQEPQEGSHYTVKAGAEWLPTGYTGTLWVDVQTAELVRLRVETDELTPPTGLCGSETVLDYGMVRLGTGDYLLPMATRQRFIGREGSESENVVSFSACREYRGESTLRFGAGNAGSAETAGRGMPSAAEFPPDLPVSIEVTSAIRSDRSAAGDRIAGRLLQPIRDRAGVVLAPEGAALEGRLMRVEVRHGKGAETVISLRWETLEAGGERLAVSLLPNRKIADLQIGDRLGLRRRGIQIELPDASDARHGVYHFPGEYVAVDGGYRTEWFTAKR